MSLPPDGLFGRRAVLGVAIAVIREHLLDDLGLAVANTLAAIAAGALSVDALKGSAKPFDARLSDVRGQPGQIRVAGAIRDLLEGSEIIDSHARCGKVQDPYSFRCQPQVMGAALDLLETIP